MAADPEAPAVIPTPKTIKMSGGSLAVTPANSVLYVGEQLEPLARILASDIRRVHGLELSVAPAAAPKKGDIILQMMKGDAVADRYDSHTVTVAEQITVRAGSYNALAMGMMTVLQAARGGAKGLTIAKMTVEDYGDRGFRALQVSIRGGYHSPQWVRKVIDVMRFYKVRVLQLHTTESLWVSSVMDSSNAADPKLLQQHSAWCKKEMDDVIAYASQRGVSMLPHNEMRPNDPLWSAALTTDFNPADKFAGYADEIDGKGKFEIKGPLGDSERFWSFVKAVTQRSYDQFARSWPGGKLPYYHIGPVYGEGGCSGKEAVKMLGFLMEKNPDIKMMYWNGPGNDDPDLGPHKKNIVVAFYSADWGGTPDGLLARGYELSNVSWTPLYVLPGTRAKAMRQGKWIFDEFNLTRLCPQNPFGEPIRNARDCSKWRKGVIGSMLATWDFHKAAAGEGHLEMITPCMPYYAEHAWSVRQWPYPKNAWAKASVAAGRLAPLVNRYIRQQRPSSTPGAVTATRGVLPAAVDIFWAESDNYPEHYQVYRSDNADSARAQPISPKIPASFVTRLNTFRDNKVKPDRKYYYWVLSINPLGASPFGRPAEGSAGGGAVIPAAYEAFDYPAEAPLEKLNGGVGFKTAWKVEEFNAPLTISSGGLTYPGLRTSGRALRVESTDSDETGGRKPPHIRIIRQLAKPYGRDGTQVWTSCLLRAERLAIGQCAVNIGRLAIGKGWGDGFTHGGGKMEAKKTYFLVARYAFHNGNDLIHVWINPTPGKQPVDTDAVIISRREDNPTSSAYGIRMQPYGKGSYDVDEIRVGAAYRDVAPTSR